MYNSFQESQNFNALSKSNEIKHEYAPKTPRTFELSKKFSNEVKLTEMNDAIK